MNRRRFLQKSGIAGWSVAMTTQAAQAQSSRVDADQPSSEDHGQGSGPRAFRAGL